MNATTMDTFYSSLDKTGELIVNGNVIADGTYLPTGTAVANCSNLVFAEQGNAAVLSADFTMSH